MLLILLLQLIYNFQSSLGAEHETLCTSDACITLHNKELSFDEAQRDCVDNGGNLITLRDKNEESKLLELIKTHHSKRLKIWIGLKRNKKDCMIAVTPLKGFQWISGEEDSQYSNWKKDPASTCLERCVKVNYTSSDPDQLKWTDAACKHPAFYACKFSFKGMCKPLSLQGTENVVYTVPFSKKATDLCGPDSCEHLCVTGESGINCRCLKGFGLSENQRNCSDIDECQSEVCQDRVCVNTVGSFLCVCKEGYDMIDGECRDADECARSGCEYSCLNNNGSLSCYCSEGFILSQDGHSCVDVNECVSSPCLSELTCINTVGSFKCTHQQKTDGSTETSLVSITPAAPSDEETQDNFPESLTRTTVELQHQSPHTDTPEPYLHNITNQDHSNRSLATNQTLSRNSRVIICVLGSVIPLLLLVTLTLFIIIFRCSRTKKEVKKKKSTADGYCWVSSGLDPRLEKLYESILTDDL
uniref:Complement component C1q receptor-like n=1 Tax=Kryptolebias marmoratus TaxID=37003 RepID=A0A3Q3ACP7_KRYMA